MIKPFFATALGIVCAVLLVTYGRSAGQQPQVPAAATKEQLIEDLVYGNRILVNEGVIDAFGHISVRDPQNPNRFYMSRSVPPSQVTRADIWEYDLDCNNITGTAGYGERFIHCGIYRARPDVQSVIHGHSLGLIPFGVTTSRPLRALFLMAGFLGAETPIFDIGQVAGDTDMMVTTNGLGDALARVLADHPVVLMRGHGQTVVGNSIPQAVVRAYYADVNARLQAAAEDLGGEVKFLSPGEASKAALSVSIERPWEMFKERIGPIE
jgi:ribulose-5-phosphate 4-epimerase/fuculose-1-phosphate aldolase